MVPRNGPDTEPAAAKTPGAEQMARSAIMPPLEKPTALTVVIGTEHTSPDLRRFSLIACTAVEGSTTRTVGVIGPTRMHYSRTIALVDGTTQAVSRVLRDVH